MAPLQSLHSGGLLYSSRLSTNPSLVLTDLANTNFSGTFTLVTATSSAGNYPDLTITGVPIPGFSGAFAPFNGVKIVAQ
jgi:hypothetical protein